MIGQFPCACEISFSPTSTDRSFMAIIIIQLKITWDWSRKEGGYLLFPLVRVRRVAAFWPHNSDESIFFETAVEGDEFSLIFKTNETTRCKGF